MDGTDKFVSLWEMCGNEWTNRMGRGNIFILLWWVVCESLKKDLSPFMTDGNQTSKF